MKKLEDSAFVSLIAVFAAFNVICDSLIGPPLPFSGVWYSWIFVSEPITGIILGPLAGFFSSFIGVMIGHLSSLEEPKNSFSRLGLQLEQ